MKRKVGSILLAFLASSAISCPKPAPPPAPPEATPVAEETPPPPKEVKKPGPPVAKVENVVDELWGVKVNDPYRYMENLDDPYVKEWFKGQADWATSVLHALPGRDELLARLVELDNDKQYRIYRISRRPDGTMFYMKLNAGENVSKLYRVDPKSKKETLLVDPAALESENNQHQSLGTYALSPDGKHVVFGIAWGGSEQTTYHVVDVATATISDDRLDRVETAYNGPQWSDDSAGFFYARRQALPDDAPPTEIYKKTSVYYHKLGTSADSDTLVAAMGHSDKVPLLDVDFPSIYVPVKSKYAILKIHHGDSSPLTLYVAPKKRLLKKNIPWVKICDVADGVDHYAVLGDRIYLMTSSGAPRFRVVQTNLRRPSFAKAKVVVPEGDYVVQGMALTKGALYVNVMQGGVDGILESAYKKPAPKALKIPGDAAGFIASASPLLRNPYVYTSSWTRGSKIYEYDPAKGSFTDTGLSPEGKFDAVSGYASKEVSVKSHDGVMVPMSILYPENIELDGKSPTLLIGYGSYGMSTYTPYFDPKRLAWLERGGVIAYAHVRGGGEKGRPWHLAGQKANKPNTWKDFIACAEYLIAEGYTSKGYLAGQGTSAGGILIGRAITERPDLFRAALIRVGDSDAIRAETTTNGVPNIAEFGTVTNEAEFHALLEMDSYRHVQDGVEYPAVLLTHGMNDPRVEPWQSGKMAARLQAATASDKPVLLRVDYEAGHGMGSRRDQKLEQNADEWAFLFSQLGK